MEEQPPEGARCALHPLEPAVGTCARCGNFTCAACRAGGALCPACRARGAATAWPMSRGSWTFEGVWGLALQAFKVNWVNLTVAVLITFGISGAVGGLGAGINALVGIAKAPMAVALGVSVAVQAVSTLVQGLLGLGMVKMLLEMFAGRPVEVALIFSGFSQLGRWLLAVLLAALMALPLLLGVAVAAFVLISAHGEPSAGAVATVVVVALAMAVYGFWVGLPLSFLNLELMQDTTTSAPDVLRNCFALADGQRLAIFGVLFVGGLVVMGGFIACCVGALPASALAGALTAALFLSLRNGAALAGQRPQA